MATFSEAIGFLSIPAVRTAVVVIALLLAVNIIIGYARSRLMRKVKTKAQVHNVKVFSMIISYVAFVVIALAGVFTYVESWSGLGLWVGFLSAALGWALQRPITGIAAWLMVVVQKPFKIGDRIVIGGVRGDVAEIRLMHIYLAEVGGLVGGEENSKRTILVPNSTLFDQNITNYTSESEHILDQVSFTITFESDLAKASRVALDAARKHAAAAIAATGQEPYVRTYFVGSGMSVSVRYMSPAVRLQEISSLISAEIFERLRKERRIELSYPHTKVLFKEDVAGPLREGGRGAAGEESGRRAADMGA